MEKYNPSFITVEELRDSVHATKDYIKELENFVMGDNFHNIRSTKNEKCISTQEQVEFLIDQATDPNILGRTWVGWASWI